MSRQPHRLDKPAYLDAPSMTRVDPEFLPDKLRLELRQMLPSDIPRDKADAFIAACGQAAQFAYSWHGEVAASPRAKELREVEVRCHALLVSLRGLSEDAASELYLAVDEAMTAADPRNSGGGHAKAVLLGGGRAVVNKQITDLWALAQAIEGATMHASAGLHGSKQDRPKLSAARVLVQDLAKAHLDAFGRWPPIGEGWFHDVAAHLGKFRGLPCGAKLVNAAIRKLRPIG